MANNINSQYSFQQQQEQQTFSLNLLPSHYNQGNVTSPGQMIGTLKEALHWPKTETGKRYVFVNERQIERIIERRKERAKSAQFSSTSTQKKQKYKYETRHLHALKRARGEGGRFCSKARSTEASAVSTATTPPETHGETEVTQISPIHQDNTNAPPKPNYEQATETVEATY
ncbi:Nuclear transcription factor Y subunit [Entamoeba marina]